jgi:hypothetical protein
MSNGQLQLTGASRSDTALVAKASTQQVLSDTIWNAVVAGVNLRDVESWGKQDPFCEVSIGGQVARTTVIEGTGRTLSAALTPHIVLC